eukprot:gene32209-39773_t
MVVVLLPIDLLLTNYLNTYQYEYAWTASSAYLSGGPPAICLLVAFSALIAFVIFIFDRYVFSNHNTFIDALTRDTIDEANKDATCGRQNVGQWACIAAVALVNLAIILPIDMVYVYIVLNENVTVVALTQFSLAIFKIVWNDIAVRKLLLYARSLYFTGDDHCKTAQLKMALEKRRETRDILFLVRMAPPPVDSSYFYMQCYKDYVSPTHGYECLSYAVNRLLPTNLRPLPSEVPTPPPQYFDKQNFIVRVNSNIAILLTFGAMCPPLAVIVCISIFSYTYYEQLAIGRLLTAIKAKGFEKYKIVLDAELQDIAQCFEHSIWIVVPFASMFYAYFVFDTLGDAVGGSKAAWVPIVMLCIPAAVFAAIRGKGCYKARKMTRDLGGKLTSRLTTISHRMSMASRPTTHRRDSSMAGPHSESPFHRGDSLFHGSPSLFRKSSIVHHPKDVVGEGGVAVACDSVGSGTAGQQPATAVAVQETEMTVFRVTSLNKGEIVKVDDDEELSRV